MMGTASKGQDRAWSAAERASSQTRSGRFFDEGAKGGSITSPVARHGTAQGRRGRQPHREASSPLAPTSPSQKKKKKQKTHTQ